MRFTALYLLIFSFFISNLHAAMQVQMSYCTFQSQSSGPYIEIYMSFVPNQLKYIKHEEGYYGEIDVTYIFNKGDSNNLVEQFIVQTPLVPDTNTNFPPFVSQHRIFLEKGDYNMHVSIRELNTTGTSIETDQKISLNYDTENILLSDIELFQSSTPSAKQNMFQKGDYEVIPYAYDIVPQEMNELGFYVELYNANKILGENNTFLITYQLENYEDGSLIKPFVGYSRKKASSKNVIMGQFLVGNLADGNYNIRIDVLSAENELLTSKKVAFHKNNPPFISQDAYGASFVDYYTNADSLAKHIEYLEPIADQLEWEFAKNQLVDKDLELMKKYFLNFWQQRNALEPHVAWKEYLEMVYITNENFDTPMLPGYLTDRGFRYLKYGKPDDRYESFDEPRAYPYEVWTYNKVRNQSNRIIVFANKSMVLNDYTILHSDINGELYNKNWNLELHRITPGLVDDPNPVMPDNFGNKSTDWTNLPR